MATPAQLQAQAAQLEIQIAQLTQQIQSANTPASQQASLIIQRSQLQNNLLIVQQETTALTQESNPPDPTVPTAGAGRGFVNPPLVQPEPQIDTPLLTPAESIARAQIRAATPGEVPVEQSLSDGEELVNTSAPAPVDPNVNPGNGSSYNPSNTSTPGANSFTAGAGTFEGGEEAYLAQRSREQQAIQARFNQPSNGDWRVRLRLAPESKYLYNSEDPGILAPLKTSDGVIFPYTPNISTSYNANYDVAELTHSNYRGQFYKNSNVGDISITATFTAQDTSEAEYMLAVIHFFRSATKMFYGQDPQRGAPPPLVYLFGLGQYQFNNHPCVVKSFTYNLPTDVDYIRTQPNNYGINLLNRRTKPVSSPANTIGSVIGRLSNARDLLGNLLKPGALSGLGRNRPGQPGVSQQAVYNTSNASYVPTKIEIQLSLLPIQTRNQVSQQFSLEGFANGALLRGGFW
jgi:hypothetical protein